MSCARSAYQCRSGNYRCFSTDASAQTVSSNAAEKQSVASSVKEMEALRNVASESSDSSRFFSMESSFEETISPIVADVQDQWVFDLLAYE